MKRFTLERKLFVYPAVIIYAVMVVLGIGLMICACFSENDFLGVIALVVLVMFGVLFICECVIARKLLSKFEVDEEKLKVYLPGGKSQFYYFSEIVDAGIYQIHRHKNRMRHGSVLERMIGVVLDIMIAIVGEIAGFETRLICFSQKTLSDKDKKRMNIMAKDDILCIRYREDVISAISQVYSFDQTEQNIHR